MYTTCIHFVGRQFYKCSKRDDEGKCNFFLWADEANTTGGGSSYSLSSSSHDPQGNQHRYNSNQLFFNRKGFWSWISLH